MKTHYKDFVGERIEIEVSPFQFNSPIDALKEELYRRICEELSYRNGLLCDFEDVEINIDQYVVVSGTVSQCEVDC